MEEILKKLEISEKTIKQMLEICPNIKDLKEEDFLEKVDILKRIKCDNIQIRNIISSNSTYLDRSSKDIENLINKMYAIGFTELNILFDGNPYILNLDAYEIENYIKNKEKNGEVKEDIIDNLSSNPFLFEEI